MDVDSFFNKSPLKEVMWCKIWESQRPNTMFNNVITKEILQERGLFFTHMHSPYLAETAVPFIPFQHR
jgi:hypothetical protein